MALIDVEQALCEYLEVVGSTFTSTKDDFEAEDLPAIRINRVGGGANPQGWEDSAQVEVNAFALTRAESQALTNQVRSLMTGAYGVTTPSGFIDSISENVSPNEIPYGLEYEDVRRTFSTWTVVSRSQ